LGSRQKCEEIFIGNPLLFMEENFQQIVLTQDTVSNQI